MASLRPGSIVKTKKSENFETYKLFNLDCLSKHGYRLQVYPPVSSSNLNTPVSTNGQGGRVLTAKLDSKQVSDSTDSYLFGLLLLQLFSVENAEEGDFEGSRHSHSNHLPVSRSRSRSKSSTKNKILLSSKKS